MLETEETTQQNVIEYALGVELTAKEVSEEFDCVSCTQRFSKFTATVFQLFPPKAFLVVLLFQTVEYFSY